jgi:hypothetical protein
MNYFYMGVIPGIFLYTYILYVIFNYHSKRYLNARFRKAAATGDVCWSKDPEGKKREYMIIRRDGDFIVELLPLDPREEGPVKLNINFLYQY